MTARSTYRGLLALLASAAASVCFSAAPVPAVSLQGASLQTASAPAAIRVADSRMSMDQAVKMAEQKFKARVVRAESQDDGGKVVYVLRLLNDSGRVWTVKVDAATGTVI